MKAQKLIVLGRGFAGLAAAWEFTRKGHHVTLVGHSQTAPTILHQGLQVESPTASRAAVGISSLKGHFCPQTPLFREKIRGHEGLGRWLHSIAAGAGQTFPWMRGPIYEAFFSDAEFSLLYERVFHKNFHGFYKNAILNSQQFRQQFAGWPCLKTPPLGAFHFYDDLWFDPQACLDRLESALMKSGAQIITGDMIDLVTSREANTHSGSPRPHLQIVILSAGQKHCLEGDQLVIACGANTNDVLGVLGYQPLPLSLCTGVTTLAKTTGSPTEDPWFLRYKKTNLVSYQSKLVFGSSSINKTQDSLGHLPPDCAIKDLETTQKSHGVTLASILHPPLETGYRWGARVRTKDRAPVIGNLGAWPRLTQGAKKPPAHLGTNIWVMTGFYKNGLQLSWSFAQKLAEAMLVNESGGSGIIEPDFNLYRFIRS